MGNLNCIMGILYFYDEWSLVFTAFGSVGG